MLFLYIEMLEGRLKRDYSSHHSLDKIDQQGKTQHYVLLHFTNNVKCLLILNSLSFHCTHNFPHILNLTALLIIFLSKHTAISLFMCLSTFYCQLRIHFSHFQGISIGAAYPHISARYSPTTVLCLFSARSS